MYVMRLCWYYTGYAISGDLAPGVKLTGQSRGQSAVWAGEKTVVAADIVILTLEEEGCILPLLIL